MVSRIFWKNSPIIYGTPKSKKNFWKIFVFIIMEKNLESLIRTIIFKKYPSLYEVSISDLMGEYDNWRNTRFICKFKSDECLSMEEQMDIDSEVKLLFTMTGSQQTSVFKKPSIQCYFDCGKGYEFQSSHGYIH